jgi:hypothetical protein
MKLSGFGLGLRTPHYEAILNEPHAIDWLEVITENYWSRAASHSHFSIASANDSRWSCMASRSLSEALIQSISSTYAPCAAWLRASNLIGFPIICAGPASRTQLARSAAAALHRRSVGHGGCARESSAGCFGQTDPIGECLELSQFSRGRDERVGILARGCARAPTATSCSTSTISMSAASITASIR